MNLDGASGGLGATRPAPDVGQHQLAGNGEEIRKERAPRGVEQPGSNSGLTPEQSQMGADRFLAQEQAAFAKNQRNIEEDDQALKNDVLMSYQKQQEDEGVNSYSQTSSFKFFFKHSYRDVGRKRCHFCLSFCSVMIVVLSALVINTVVDKGPIIFLKLAEMNVGQYDGIIYPSKGFSGIDKYNNVFGIFVNYTRVQEVVDHKYNLAPRKQFCGSKVASDFSQTQRRANDEEYYGLLQQKYVPTSDGGTTLPTRDMVYDQDENRQYLLQSCLMFMDTQLERDIDLGSRYKFDPMKEGTCLINEQMADSLKVTKGDIIYTKIDMYQNLIALIDKFNEDVADPQKLNRISRADIKRDNSKVELPCRVAYIGDQSYGKLPKDAIADQIIMEYGPFYKLLARYLPAGSLSNNEHFKKYLMTQGSKKAYELADFMMMTLPNPRINYYSSSNYFDIQRGVTGYANDVIESLGFFPVRMKLDVLEQMETYSEAILFLGLIFNVIIVLFIILSVLLIYSLLMISVETKTFEFGVMRMVGLSKSGIINMIILQSFMFVLPSVFVGFLMSFPGLYALFAAVFSSDMGVDTRPVPSTYAVYQALFVGIIIPLLSSIAPIQSALKKNLNESLDIQRSKTQAMYVEILDPRTQNMGSYIVFGTVAVVYGFSIYYFLPLAMLSFNFALILNIFFFILISMLFGLSLLAFNLQRFIEILLTYVFLIFEKSSMRQMVLKNLTAHKMRNKMTSIIYSIALGFIIFLIVSYNLQIKSTQLQELQRKGSYFQMQSNDQQAITTKVFDPLLQRNHDVIESFAYVTPDLKRVPDYNVLNQKSSDNARINSFGVDIYGVQPSMFDSTLDDFLKVYWRSNSALSLGDQFYTAKGSQSVAVGQYNAEVTNTNPRFFNESILIQAYSTDLKLKPNKYYRKRPLFTTSQAPAFTMKDRSPAGGSNDPAYLMSLPSYNRMNSPTGSLNDTKWERLFVKFKDPENKTVVKNFIQECKAVFTPIQANGIKIFNYFDDTETTDQVSLILDIIFSVIISITMFLCFFSLCSSMSANLLDQTKELGVLRAMGYTKHKIQMLYVYEAFVLVMASSLLGVMIGTIVGFTMVLQQVVFTQIPLVFFFPWTQFGIIMVMSFLCAIGSTWGPSRALLQNEIAHVFRLG